MKHHSEARRKHREPEQEAAASLGDEGASEASEVIEPRQIVRMIERFARESPHAAIASACAVGFLLGGGLTPRMLGMLVTFAGRQALRDVMREALEGAVQGRLAARAEG